MASGFCRAIHSNHTAVERPIHQHIHLLQMVFPLCACFDHRARAFLAGEYDLDDWVQNCLQLSAYFINLNAFALAEYCLSAANALLAKHGIHIQSTKKQQQQQGAKQADKTAAAAAAGGADSSGKNQGLEEPCASAADTATGATSRDDQEQQQQQLTVSHDGKGSAIPAAAAAAAAVHDGEKHPDQGNSSSTSSSKECRGQSGMPAQNLSADIAANVHLARAKLNLYRLVASLNAMRGQKLEMKYSDPASLPEPFR